MKIKSIFSKLSLNRSVFFIVILCLIMALQTLTLAKAAAHDAVENQFIVKFSSDCNERKRRNAFSDVFSDAFGNIATSSLLQQINARRLEEFSSINAELWQTEQVETLSEAISIFSSAFNSAFGIGESEESCIEYIEPNYIVTADQIPNDPYFSEQWGLAKIDASRAWDINTESDEIIAIIDTGVDYTHPDLKDNMWINSDEIPNNGIDDDGNGYIDDVYGYDFVNNDGAPLDDNSHGTHIAGIIAAVGNNAIGTVGVNWSAKIMALKFLDSKESGNIAHAIKSIEYATRMDAKIMNNSWGGNWGNGVQSQALYDAIQAAQKAGNLVIATAGNNSLSIDKDIQYYPSGYDLDNIISVAATNKEDELAHFSNYGKNSVDLGAPGLDIYSTFLDDSYDYKSGTSMAAPYVTGVAALLWAANPSWTYKRVKKQILSSVDKLPSLKDRTVSGGRLNAYRALTDEVPFSVFPDFSQIIDSLPSGDQPNNQLDAHIIAEKTRGFAPLTVSLDGSESEGQVIEYKWEAKEVVITMAEGDGSTTIVNGDGLPTSVSPSQSKLGKMATFTFDSPGVYVITLTVKSHLETTASNITIIVCDNEDEDECGHQLRYTVPFFSAGFYVADIILANGEEGAWGLSINTTTGINVGGFNGGAILKENGGMPGFITFTLTETEHVSITPYEYTGNVDWLTVQLEKQDLSTLERTSIYSKDTLSNTKLTTQLLEPGFYVVTIYSQNDSPRGISGITVNANSMMGGVNIGGWIDTIGVGFGAFSVAEPQDVNLTLFFGDNYGEVGAKGYLVLNIYRQYDDGRRQLYWTNNGE